MSKKILLLPGDGIGQEVINEAEKVIHWMNRAYGFGLECERDLIGGAAYDAYGTPLADATLKLAQEADAVLMGAVGGPQYDDVPREVRPEAGLLRIRKEMDLFANLRPAVAFDALLGASSLKPEVLQGLDILIVRELTAGVYFGTPRGMQTLPDGTERCVDTQSYTQGEIERVTRVAFDLARSRQSTVHSVEKANVMETGAFWRRVVTDLHAREGAGITLEHMYADNCAMQLVRTPKQFDVIVTDNLFGDVLSDCAAMLTGSLGMLPSASLGAEDNNGKRPALYEPVHGSAPDIAGQNKANPLAMLMSLAMLLQYSLGENAAAKHLENAIQAVLSDGIRTGDILDHQAGQQAVSTSQMGDAVIDRLG